MYRYYMKIGMVTTQFADTGGVENVVRSISKELNDENEVHLITRERAINTEEFSSEFEKIHVIEGTENYKDFLLKGRKFLKNNQYNFDILHFHNWSPILPAFGLNKPTILTFHGTTFDVKMSDKEYIGAGLYWVLEEISLNIPDKVTSITQAHLRPFHTFKDIEIIRNGVNTEEYKPAENQKEQFREKWNIQGKGVLIVGKHVQAKNHSQLIEAVSQVEQETTLMIPSDGPLRQDLEQKVEKLDVNAEFYGTVSKEELIELYQSADLFCLPSKNEGLPLSMLEALSSGLPVLVSDIGDNKEIIERSRAGKTFSPDNTENLQKKIVEILESDLDQKSENARAFAEELDWKNISFQYQQLYREMM
ncbi:MAG: hypothetical protein BRC28_03170 [Nanohaloarchaea archaeon SW_4_43_9]|nr:MAG: hypothetical protein BRC28_03170 [Nanohaloarchaea archaeon SW_4_43_9]